MKSVLISIQPRWCELIANGTKTIEVRKTRPKIAIPFVCYIYCTKAKYPHEDFITVNEGTENAFAFYGGGKVIGEFICDKINEYPYTERGYKRHFSDRVLSCVTEKEINKYGKGETLYGWHISELVIYDEPKEATEFYRLCPLPNTDTCYGCKYLNNRGKYYECVRQISKAPQSWCYVEEM